MENICEFCTKKFATKVNLLQHQRTVKKCLILQGKQEEETKYSKKCKNYYMESLYWRRYYKT